MFPCTHKHYFLGEKFHLCNLRHTVTPVRWIKPKHLKYISYEGSKSLIQSFVDFTNDSCFQILTYSCCVSNFLHSTARQSYKLLILRLRSHMPFFGNSTLQIDFTSNKFDVAFILQIPGRAIL